MAPLFLARLVIIVKNDILSNNSRSSRFSTPCIRCKLCANISKNKSEFVSVNDRKLRIISGGSCKSSHMIYAAFCTKHNKRYIGETGKTLSDRFNRHRYDIKKIPDNCEFAEHFQDGRDLHKDKKGTGILSFTRIVVYVGLTLLNHMDSTPS